MAEEKKVYLPPTGPLVVKLPQEPIGEVLKHFSGRITPRTFAAAKRLQAKPGTLRVPTHLLRKLWELTGGWKGIECSVSDYVGGSRREDSFPHRTMGVEYSRSFERDLPGQEKVEPRDRTKERVPWRKHAYGCRLGELEVMILPLDRGPVVYLRWRGWVVGRIGGWRAEWLDVARAREFKAGLGRRLSDAEADGWGFLTAEEVAKG